MDASQHLLGTHDFTSCCSARTEVEDKIRTIKSIDFSLDDDTLTLHFVGNGFLYNMVRILVGTLLEVGQVNVNQRIFLPFWKKGTGALPEKQLLLKDCIFGKYFTIKIFIMSSYSA